MKLIVILIGLLYITGCDCNAGGESIDVTVTASGSRVLK